MKIQTAILVILVAVVVAWAAGHYSARVSPDGNAGGDAAAPHKIAAAEAEPADTGDFPATMPVKGPADALVTILEISDFQCPFCSRVGPTLKKVMEDYPNDVRIAWANNALPFHDRAKPAATGALAAHRQGKFWEFHDKLFANQRELSDDNMKKWAGEVGLDVARWQTDIKDPALAKQIEHEMAAAGATGARGTPGFFINGKLLSGAQPYEAFKGQIDEALAAARKHKEAGKSGLALMAAAWAERDADAGPKVLKYFVKGETPEAEAAKPAERRPAPAAEAGPAKAPPESYEIWKVPVDVKNDHIIGDNDAALVTIVEFSDFECPFCSRGKNTVDEVRQEYGDKVRVVFRHHPLPFHKAAGPAHQASIAAGRQGKFWEYHDKLFANARELTEENLKKWAGELGLNMSRFDKDRNDAKAAARVQSDIALAGTISVRGTPNFLINGRKLVGAQPLPVFKAVIDEEIEKANKAGKSGQRYYESIVAKGKIFSELDSKVNDFDLSKLPWHGAEKAKVTIVEFSDFQCPYCSRVGGPVKAAMERFPGKVKLVFAHYPLSFHKEAKPASVMAQGAYEQGGPELFWKVHDALFAAQRELSAEKIKAIGTEAGVDVGKVEANQRKHEKLIADTMEMGTKGGVNGTPSLFINGRKYEPSGGMGTDAIAATIDKVLKGTL